jgi:hypothetical protein
MLLNRLIRYIGITISSLNIVEKYSDFIKSLDILIIKMAYLLRRLDIFIIKVTLD